MIARSVVIVVAAVLGGVGGALAVMHLGPTARDGAVGDARGVDVSGVDVMGADGRGEGDVVGRQGEDGEAQKRAWSFSPVREDGLVDAGAGDAMGVDGGVDDAADEAVDEVGGGVVHGDVDADADAQVAGVAGGDVAGDVDEDVDAEVDAVAVGVAEGGEAGGEVGGGGTIGGEYVLLSRQLREIAETLDRFNRKLESSFEGEMAAVDAQASGGRRGGE